MANQLAMDKAQAIKTLASTGLSERQIATALSVSNRTPLPSLTSRVGCGFSPATPVLAKEAQVWVGQSMRSFGARGGRGC